MKSMGITFKKRDSNRYRKVYGTFRRPEHYTMTTSVGSNFVIEVAEVFFHDQSSGSYTFKEKFKSTPIVTIVATTGDVNVYLSSVSQGGVSIEASGDFSGSVFLHAIEVGS